MTDQLPIAGFGVSNYRSFDENGFVLDSLSKINILIGKNNSGKSNVFRAISLLHKLREARMPQRGNSDRRGCFDLVREIDSYQQKGAPPSATIILPLDNLLGEDRRFEAIKEQVQRFQVRWNTETGAHYPVPEFDKLGDNHLVAIFEHISQRSYRGTPKRKQAVDDLSGMLVERAVQACIAYFSKLVWVDAFRQIKTAQSETNGSILYNGANVIADLRRMQHPKIGHEDDKRAFLQIQSFVSDLIGERSLTMEIPAEEDAIYLQMQSSTPRLPLDSYGTGIHELVLLCAALAIKRNHVFCIEEPEIHFHPELQRQFIRFLARTDNRYFITTHSNVLLDAAADTTIYHVTNDGCRSIVARVDATRRGRQVLVDLGYKASDLLQANCVIWVEGPSDRVYLNRWLSLADGQLVEGLHYSVAFYGGKVLAHFSGSDDPESDAVEVLRINKHAVFVMDRDDVGPDGKLNATKERIRDEMVRNNDGLCWVTQGREIENYLRPSLLKSYLAKANRSPRELKFELDDHLEDAISQATTAPDSRKIDYASKKVAIARELVEMMEEADLDSLDLRTRIAELVASIRKWNHLLTLTPGATPEVS